MKKERMKKRVSGKSKHIQELSTEQKYYFAQQLLLNEILSGSNWCHDLGETRHRIFNLCNRVGVKPVIIFRFLDATLHPRFELLLLPFTKKEVEKWTGDDIRLSNEVMAWKKAHNSYQHNLRSRHPLPEHRHER